jgi:hypothetical protein
MPKRERPKKFKHNPADHAALHRRWKSWLPDMKRDLSDLLGKEETFWDLQEVAKENEKILNPGNFFDWMCRNYVVAQVIGIRSFLDCRKDSRSLWRMLYEILENPGVIDRGRHVRKYRTSPLGESLGHLSFDAVAGRGRSALTQRSIRADLRALEDEGERIRRFANKRIAHRTSPGKIRRLPKFDDVDAALSKIDEIFCKYNLLLTANGSSSMRATKQFDWKEVLYEPWIPRGSKLRAEA